MHCGRVNWLHRSDLAREPLCKEPWYRLKSGDSTHHCRSPTPKLNGCDLPPSTRTQFSEQEYSYLTVSKRHQSNTVLPLHPQNFSRGTRQYTFPRSTKHVYTYLACSQDFSKIFWSGNLFCSATTATKTALGIIQLWFNYFRGIMACTPTGRLSKEMSW